MMSGLRKTYRREPEPEERGVRVVLAQRPRRKPLALALASMGLIFLGVASIALASALLADPSEGASLVGRIGSALFTLPFFAGGLGLLLGALTAWNSHCTIELTPEELRVVEYAGRLRWTRRRPSRRLRSLEVLERNEPRGTAAGVRWQLEARFEGGSPFAFALGYPQPKLEEVAAFLREAALDWGEEVEDRAPTPFVAAPATPFDEPDAAPQPGEVDTAAIGTEIQVHPTANGLVVTVPPVGVWRGSHGLFLLGLLFVTFISLLGGFAVFANDGDSEWRDALIGVLVCSLFFAVGAAMMAFGWNLGRRSARFTVDAEGLFVERQSPFGDSSQRFARGEIEDVRAGQSGVEVNDVPVLELQVFVGGEKVLGLLSQRSDDECRALAARLRDALRG